MSKIRETIHHGDYYHVREIEYPDGVGTYADDAVAALTLLGHTSPYPFTFSLTKASHQQAAHDLEHKGSCDIGWARYEILDDEEKEDDEAATRARLEYLRQELRAERISWAEVSELQSLAAHIAPGDVELLEAAGVPEYDDTEAESVSVSDMDNLVARASAWDAVSNALDDNAADLCSAADVCQVGFDQQEELRKAAENA